MADKKLEVPNFNTVDEYVQEAQKLAKKKKHELAIAHLRKASELDSSAAALLAAESYRLGTATNWESSTSQNLKYFEFCIELKTEFEWVKSGPDYFNRDTTIVERHTLSDAYLRQANCLVELKRYDIALEALSNLSKRGPDKDQVCSMVHSLLKCLNHKTFRKAAWDGAESILSSLTLEPAEECYSQAWRACALFDEKKNTEALEESVKALDLFEILNPVSPAIPDEVLYWFGPSLNVQGEKRPYYQQVIANMLWMRSWFYFDSQDNLQREKFKRDRDYISTLTRIQSYFEYDLEQASISSTAKAIEICRRLLEYDPKNLRAWQVLATVAGDPAIEQEAEAQIARLKNEHAAAMEQWRELRNAAIRAANESN